jgi:glucokinase
MVKRGHPAEFVVGVDVGATKILSGVIDLASLSVVGAAKTTTKAERGPTAVMERVARCVADAVDECDLTLPQVRAVGIGVPGVVDLASGRVLTAASLGWKDLLLREEMEQRLGRPVLVGNDCALATLAVHTQELQARPRHLLGLFVGSGVGAGRVIDGQLLASPDWPGGDVAHMVIRPDGPRCACGQHGCLETLAGRNALRRDLLAAVRSGQRTVLTEMLGRDLRNLRSGDLRRALRHGDSLVARMVRDAAVCVGLAVVALVRELRPEVVVLGGGLIEALESDIMPVVLEAALPALSASGLPIPPLLASKLGDHASLIGAALLVRQQQL